MGIATCEREGASVVLAGSFNPGIFQPAWFGSRNLLRKEEADAAVAGPDYVLTRDVSQFSAGWLELQVTAQRFSAQTSDPTQYDPLRDLVLSTFRLLEFTPFNQMGINRLMHYRMPSDEEWHAFGHFLAPKQAWQDHVRNPGLLSLSITGKRLDLSDVKYTTKVEPSTRVQPGVFIETNEHYQLDGNDTSGRLMRTLEESWRSSQEYARNVAERLFAKFYESK